MAGGGVGRFERQKGPMDQKAAPMKVTRKRQYYDVAYKRNAVELAIREGHSVRAAAAVFNVSAAEFYRWRREYGPAPSEVVPGNWTGWIVKSKPETRSRECPRNDASIALSSKRKLL